MSISDSAGAAEVLELVKAKRIQRPLTKEQWQVARVQFETGDKIVTHAIIAERFNTSLSSVQKRSQAEQWQKGLEIVQSIKRDAANALQSAASIEAKKAGELAGRQIAKELQPWIEKEKRLHIKRAITRSKAAFKRLDKVSKGYQVYDAKRGTLTDVECAPKDEMHLATAEDKYDGIIRRNLGMSDSGGLSGSLSLNILTGSAAIQVNATQPGQ